MSDEKYTWPNVKPKFDVEGLWRIGPDLLMRRDTKLPPLCVKTGEPAESTLLRKFFWQSRLARTFTRFRFQRATVELPLSQSSLKRRSVTLWVCGAVIAMSVILGIRSFFTAFGAGVPSMGFMLWGVLAGVAFFIANSHYSVLRPTMIDEGYVRLRGVHESILEQLPRRSDW
jgi:hypothetical protein